MQLAQFPRPESDNGMGICFGSDLRPSSLESYVPRLRSLRFKWCIVPHTDELQFKRAAEAMWHAGTMPVSHLICHVDDNTLDFRGIAKTLDIAGIPPYVQIFDKPHDPWSWKTQRPNLQEFIERWIFHAGAVIGANGFPGLQLRGPNDLRAVLKGLKQAKAHTVLDRMWFSAHAYGSNRPPDGVLSMDQKQQHENIYSFLSCAIVFQQELGFVPPMIVGGGGWQYGNQDDPQYPKIDDSFHAQYHVTLFKSFGIGRLPNGAPLPDYLLAFCPSLLFGNEECAWYSWVTGTRKQTIIGVEGIAPFVRKFAWEGETPRRLEHYVLLGSPSQHVTQLMLIGARHYIARFGPVVGFDPKEASYATFVTVIGDGRAVPPDVDRMLQEAGCRVERLAGDQYTVDAILEERVAHGQRYGEDLTGEVTD